MPNSSIPLISHYKVEIVVVDDNSPDGTANEVKNLAEKYSDVTQSIKLYSREKKLGLGSAYIFGLKYCTGNYVFLMDADLSHHPKYMVEFIKQIHYKEADINQCRCYDRNKIC